MSAPALTMLKRRARAYGWACAWLVLLGGYLVVSGLLNGLPDVRSHAAFTSIQVHSSLLAYWQNLHLPQAETDLRQIAGLPGLLFYVVPGGLDVVLCLPIMACLIWRKYRLLIPLLLVAHLAFQAQAVCNHRIAYHATPVQALTPAIAARLAGDAVAATPPPAFFTMQNHMLVSCEPAGPAQATVSAAFSSDCSPPWMQAMLHHVLMQRAYLAGDVATARAQYDAIDPNFVPATWGIGWRLAVVREWLVAEGQPPAKTIPTEVMAPSDVRLLSGACLAAGGLVLGLSALLLALALGIHRRTVRLSALMPAGGTA